jgi:glutamyl-tRNA synthetase
MIENAAKLSFLRREAFYDDMVKGRLAKPLDGMKDLIIVRGDGSPVFHLANVLDDIAQGVTHIVRGDDHVENTYRHLFLFAAFGAKLPAYAHMPMIVNASGKPYSKRDGDAFVGDFREKGFLPEALFNYLALLGWSPGDDREKMSKDELVSLFTIERVKSSPAQFDMRKLVNMNGLYMAELPFERFSSMAWDYAARYEWRALASKEAFDSVAKLMQSRTKTFADMAAWSYFFSDAYPFDEKSGRKHLSDEAVRKAVGSVAARLEAEAPASPEEVERLIHAVEESQAFKPGSLNQPLRLAATGTSVGAGVYETIALLGAKRCAGRILETLSRPLAG